MGAKPVGHLDLPHKPVILLLLSRPEAGGLLMGYENRS